LAAFKVIAAAFGADLLEGVDVDVGQRHKFTFMFVCVIYCIC
jgi:hypothetical protein